MVNSRADARLDRLEKAVGNLEKRTVSLNAAVDELNAQFLKTDERVTTIASQLETFIAEVRAALSPEKSSAKIGSNDDDSSIVEIRKSSGKTGSNDEESSDNLESNSTDKTSAASLTMPSFDGSEAVGWLARAEQYFLVSNTPAVDRVKVAMVALAGPALPWYQLLIKRVPTLSWDRFVQELMKRFGNNGALDEYEASAPEPPVSKGYSQSFSSQSVVGPNRNPSRRFRNMTSEEYKKHLAAGTCFRCGLKFDPTHRCSPKTLNVLVFDEEEVYPTEGLDRETEEEDVSGELQLSQMSSNGLDSSQAMQLFGQIGCYKVLVMVDSGASHCFISDQLTTSLALRVTPTIPYSVTLGDGSRIRAAGICRNVALTLESEVFTVSCYVFPLRNIDVILGVSWLASLGDVTANWNDLSMKFSVQGRLVALRGDPSLTRRACSTLDMGDSCWVLRSMVSAISSDQFMALVLAIQHWRPYLLGRHFVVYTDQRNRRQLLVHPLSTPAQQNWAAKLLGYDFSIVYKEGRLNWAADALSRRDTEQMELAALSRPVWPDGSAAQTSLAADAPLPRIKSELEASRPATPRYELVHGILFYKGRFVVPSNSEVPGQNLPASLWDTDPPVLPEQLLDRRSKTRDVESHDQVLIQWLGQEVYDAIWVEVVDMQGQFPDPRLEDKASSTAGAIDTRWRVYKRGSREAVWPNQTAE